MKCPCGCGKEVPNGHYWATENCGKRAKKFGMYMPRSECRYEERKKRRFSSKKGKQ